MNKLFGKHIVKRKIENSGDRGMSNVPKLYFDKSECCGCTACYSICPMGAISMLADEEGFLYPEIDESKCIRCRKCVNVCAIK